MIDISALSKLSEEFGDLHNGAFFTVTPSKTLKSIHDLAQQQMWVWRKKDDTSAVSIEIENGVIKEDDDLRLFEKNEKVIPLSL